MPSLLIAVALFVLAMAVSIIHLVVLLRLRRNIKQEQKEQEGKS
ncbi:hypothetical protein FACS189476_11290 [Spirochaetia bacterium]|nr:hypothetical protein FACS189476_11290 [Spirochaetia bacterium]